MIVEEDDKMKTQKAGCILINKETKKIGLIYREEYKDYSFPKGHIEEGETLLECALRETAEETKRDSIPYSEEPIIMNYQNAREGEIEVYYYLVLDNGKSDNTSLDTHDLVWVPYEKVEEKLSYDNLKELWNEAKDSILEIINK